MRNIFFPHYLSGEPQKERGIVLLSIPLSKALAIAYFG